MLEAMTPRQAVLTINLGAEGFTCSSKKREKQLGDRDRR
jgi:hypothetical protein